MKILSKKNHIHMRADEDFIKNIERIKKHTGLSQSDIIRVCVYKHGEHLISAMGGLCAEDQLLDLRSRIEVLEDIDAYKM